MKPLPVNYTATYWRDFPEDIDYDGTVRWFGDPWPSAEYPAPVCHPLAYVGDLPPNALCAYCLKSLSVDIYSGIGIPGEDGYLWYCRDCWFDILGIGVTDDGF